MTPGEGELAGFTIEDDVLTLNNFNFASNNVVGIYLASLSDINIKIKIVGTVNISGADYGIYCIKPLTITGDGNLNIENTSDGNFDKYGDSCKPCALYSGEGLSISDAKINAKGTSGSSDVMIWGTADKETWYVVDGGTSENPITFSKGITVAGDVHVILKDGCNLTIAGQTNENGIVVNGSLTVYGQTEGTGVLKATGGWSQEENQCDGIRSSGAITINGGNVIATGNGGDYRGVGIKSSGTVTVNGGTVSATGEVEAVYYAIGIDAANLIVADTHAVKAGLTENPTTVITDTDNDGNYADESGFLEMPYVKIKPKTPVCYIDADTTDGDFDSTKGDVKYTSVQAAITAAGATPTNIKMLADSEENVTIASGQEITLDLNGYVLKGAGTADNPASVITNNGTLTVKDSNTDNKVHYFTADSDGFWSWDDSNTENAVDYNSLNTYVKSAVVKVTGGCITGGTGDSAYNGGGIYNCNGATFELNSGYIVANNCVGEEGSYGGGGI